MFEQVFPVTGHKVASLFADDDALCFSSQDFNSVAEFQSAWDKKLSLATKVKISYEAIRAVRQEDGAREVAVAYRGLGGFPASYNFTFRQSGDEEAFFTYLQQRHFVRQYEKLSPVRATVNYAIGAVLVVALTWFCYAEALKLASGTAAPARNGKEELFNELVGTLGDKGVLAVGGLGLAYLLYKVWTRFTNPPFHQRFVPSAA